MKKMKIAVVGAGPAGGYLAMRLAEMGVYADVYDPTHPREKPCGGVISSESLEYVPWARDLKSANKLTKLLFQTPLAHQFTVKHVRESISVNRREFDGYLLQSSIEAGARHIEKRVIGLTFNDEGVFVHTKTGSENYNLVCGADGINSIVAESVGMKLPVDELGFTMGGWGPVIGSKDMVKIRFGDHIGYSWIINRKDCSSIGIGGPMCHRKKIERAFSIFCKEQAVDISHFKPYAWVIPFSKSPGYLEKDRSGRNWLLVGDAAGFCDPLTGEGIHLALASAHLASIAIASRDYRAYDSMWKKSIAPNLFFGFKHRDLLASLPFTEALLAILKNNPEMGLSLFKLL